MTGRRRLVTILATGVAPSALAWWLVGTGRLGDVQRLASPGPLSASHAFLASDCGSCHTPVAGITRISCMGCHATATHLLERQPTAFHATIESCASCHLEHQRESTRPVRMQHAALAPDERRLDCQNCHANDDPHRQRFGGDCQSCHRTASWNIPAFLHPSARSVSCVQCHQGPPSHYMGHFRMVSQRVARQPDTPVEQCYRCHQTTAWNDIVGVGWYKHH